MKEIFNRRLVHIKDVESCLFYALGRINITSDVDLRIELLEAIKVLEKEYCSFVL